MRSVLYESLIISKILEARFVVPAATIIHTDGSTQILRDFSDIAVPNQRWLGVRLLLVIWAIWCGSFHRFHSCAP